MKIHCIVMFAALTLGSSPVAATPKGAPAAKTGSSPAPPDFKAMMGFMDKLFPPQPDPDPARLALARTSVQAMWPDGAYGKIMTGFMGDMVDRVMQLRTYDLEALGVNGKKSSSALHAEQSLHDALAAKDPYFDQRIAAVRQVIEKEVEKVSAVIDPRMRDGMARAMARRFDAQQLADINAFFATPSGRALGAQYMQLWLDPETIRSIFGSFPEMIDLMPEMMEKLKAANDKFPQPPQAKAAPER